MGEDEDGSKDKPSRKNIERDKRNTFRGFAQKVESSDFEPQAAAFEEGLEPSVGAIVESPSDASDGDPATEQVVVAHAVVEHEISRAIRRGQPAVDIDLIHERRTAPLPDHEWIFVEIWTRNTIYQLDSRLVCIAVVDQNTRKMHPDHALIGARLVGGQRRDGESMELSHPFPRPGSEAVFEQSKGRQVRFSQTSSVTRVVLRLRVLTVSSENILPTWEEITGRHEEAIGSRKKRKDK